MRQWHAPESQLLQLPSCLAPCHCHQLEHQRRPQQLQQQRQKLLQLHYQRHKQRVAAPRQLLLLLHLLLHLQRPHQLRRCLRPPAMAAAA